MDLEIRGVRREAFVLLLAIVNAAPAVMQQA